jgi:hypothetical protein
VKPLPSEILATLRAWKGALPGIPDTAEGMSMIAGLIWNMIGTRTHWEFLRDEAFPRMRRFSFPELRGIFCTRYQPADGIVEYATETPGFTAADLESEYHERERKENERRLLEYKRLAKLAPPAEPLRLPGLVLESDADGEVSIVPPAPIPRKSVLPERLAAVPRIPQADFDAAIAAAPQPTREDKRKREEEFRQQLLKSGWTPEEIEKHFRKTS